jgi:hypothetical protein
MSLGGPIYDTVPEMKEINIVWEDHNMTLTEEYYLGVLGYITKPIMYYVKIKTE